MNTESEDPLFGTVERRLFRATTVLFCLVALAGLVGLVAWILATAAAVFYNLILPLSVAGVLALVLFPVVDALEARLRVPRVAAVVLILMLLIATLAGVIFLLLPALLQELVDFGNIAPEIVGRWQDYLSRRFPAVTAQVTAAVHDGALDGVLPSLESTGMAIKSSIGVLLGLGFVPLFLFFTLLSGASMRGQAAELVSVFSPATQRKILYFMDVFVGQVTAFFQGQLIIAVLMGALFATGFTLIGLKLGILIGLFLGLFNIVPYLGTLIGLLIVLPLAYLQPDGGIRVLGSSLAVFAIVQLLESWLLTPKIMANRSGLHPALVVIAIIFWGTALGGVLGMILAVPLTAFIVAIWSQVKGSLTRSMKSDDDDEAVIYTGNAAEAALPETLVVVERS